MGDVDEKSKTIGKLVIKTEQLLQPTGLKGFVVFQCNVG